MGYSMKEARAACRYVLHYYRKNGYLPLIGQLFTVTPEVEDLLVQDGVLQRVPLYEGGPLIHVALTDKGTRIVEEPR